MRAPAAPARSNLTSVKTIFVKILGRILPAVLILYSGLFFYLEYSGKRPPLRVPVKSTQLTEADFFEGAAEMLDLSPETLWKPKPGAMGSYVAFNRGGFRARTSAPAARTPGSSFTRVAVLGDGAALGSNVIEPGSWAAILESLMLANGIPGELFNFGVPGFTAVQGAMYAKWVLKEYEPDLLLICFGGYHDCEPSLNGASDRELIAKHSDLFHRARIFMFRFGVARWAMGDFEFGDAPPVAARARATPEEFRSAIAEIVRIQKTRGGRCAIVLPAFSAGVDEKRPDLKSCAAAARAVAESEGVPCIDVNDMVRAWNPPVPTAFFDSEIHYSAAAMQAVAEFIGVSLRDGKMFESPPKNK
ncbi:MAG: hypothetical protein HY286_03920 [Planctomycetes bacterium]|nr:hypothetical protein [Planctomycetota bacterium]